MKKLLTLLLVSVCYVIFANSAQGQTANFFWSNGIQVPVTIDRTTGYAYLANDKSPLVPTGKISVCLKKGVQVSSVLALVNGLFVVSQGNRNCYILGLSSSTSVFSAADIIYRNGNVDWSFPEFLIKIVPTTQNDPLYASQYYLNNTGQTGGLSGMDINAPEAWAISKGVNKIKVAVIDTGVEPHEDLQEIVNGVVRSRVVLGLDVCSQSNPGLPNTPESYRYHGEACAGIIAAAHNNIGIAGVAPCSDICSVNIFSHNCRVVLGGPEATTTEIASGIDWSWEIALADVLSNSWGYSRSGCSTGSVGQPFVGFPDINQAILNARTYGRNGKGCAVVFSSGNDRCSTNYPANLPGVIAVNAISKNGQLATYSNFGPASGLSAFGGEFINVSNSYECDIVTTDLMGTSGASPGNYYNNFGGTSAACPQVSGAIALMLSVNPNLTETSITNILRSTATDMGTPGFDNTFGYGRLNVELALKAAAPISGPSVINYAGGNTFTVPNQPNGVQINWSAYVTSTAQPFSNMVGTGQSYTPVPFVAYACETQGTITAVISGPCGTATLSKSITFPGSACNMAANTSVQLAEVSLSPNPGDKSIEVNLTPVLSASAQSETAQIFDLLLLDSFGQTRAALKQTSSKLSLDISLIPDGVYVLRVSNDAHVYNKRLVIKH